MVSKAVPSVHNAKQGKKPELPEKWAWVVPSVWTDRMLVALENEVKGGKWFSLIDKISSVRTLTAAWEQIAANRGSAGVDRISIMEVMKSWTPTSGTPQGAVISPLLSNLYLHELDMLINGAGYTMVRYADDWDTVLKPASDTFARRAWQACGNVFGKRPNVLVARVWMRSFPADFFKK